MNKQNKWRMNRAGLLNFWYYDDEIFDFADGKLLLRGSNGSGKSVTMQSILPILLDGKKSPDRLDPFGSRARKIEDYLLGEKEIVDRDERTGYLFLEYKREDTNQYMTTGIGLQARRYKSLNFWGFVITDNRRIGKDFYLYEYEHHAGEKQQIPLSRVQLENRIGTGGHVVRTQGDYMKLVNKYIFGFETLEAYEDLIKLLIQLRSPKLSKDFRPTVIYEILEAALPPLTDEDLRHLSDTIEHMDQTKQQMEQLEREQAALDRIIDRYHTYNAYRLADTAHHYIGAKRKLKGEELITVEKQGGKEELAQQIATITDRNRVLEQQEHVLEMKQKRLAQHKVWNLEETRAAELERLNAARQDYERKDQAVMLKAKQELQTKERLNEVLEKISDIESKMNSQLLDLETDANETSFTHHALNAQDFERHLLSDFDFSVWKKEAQSHYEALDRISEQLRSYEQTKEQIADIEKLMGETQLEIDQTKREEKDWMHVFEKDKQEKINDIYEWTEAHSFLAIDSSVLQQVSRDLLKLYEPVSYEAIRQPFYHASHHYQQRLHEQIAMKKSERTEKKQYKEKLEQQLQEWKEKRDPEPPFQRDETKHARTELQAANSPYIPFYEAVEFQEHVNEETRRHIEAALIDTGLLDALITTEDIRIEHDRMIKPNPHMMAHTLADYLVPDMDDESNIPASHVDDVLQSILVDGEDRADTAMIRADGSYRIGIVDGHAVPVETVRFIGKNARKRYREEEMKRLSVEIETVTVEGQHIQDEIDSLQEQILVAQSAMESFPHDEDIQEAYKQIGETRFKIDQLQKQLISHDQTYSELLQTFQGLKRKLVEATTGLNIEFSHVAYTESKQIQLRYERELSHLEKWYVTFRHEQKMKNQTAFRLQELEEEVDDLKGELNIIFDQQSRLKQNIAEIERELEVQGMEDVRQQIQLVQKQLSETKAELDQNKYKLPHIEATRNNLINDIMTHEQKVRFYNVMMDAWSDSFSQEIQYQFVALPEGMDTIDDQAKWCVKQYKHLLKESTKIEEQLTKAYFEQHANLIEYRMTEFTSSAPNRETDREEWTDEQTVLLQNWENKSTRRLIELDFQGKRLSPYSVRDIVTEDYSRQQTLLDDQDRQLYEDILFDSVGKKLRSRIHRAQKWTKQMNDLMLNSNSTSGISFSIQWKPRTAETETELDTKELVDLLRRDPRLLKEENINQVMDHFRTKIERAKELIDVKGEGSTLLQVLKEVLDYRYWFSFVLSYQRVGEPKRELTNNAFYKFSGGEKAMAMYIPLFTACYSRYLEADPTAPYIISLDEAFAGVDDDNISVMFRIVEELSFDYIMNSQVLWGDYETVSALSICELVRPKNANFVSVIRYLWDGKTRNLVVDRDEEEVEADDSRVEEHIIKQ